MRNLKLVLQTEPAAIGSLVASILPVLILLGLMPSLDDARSRRSSWRSTRSSGSGSA